MEIDEDGNNTSEEFPLQETMPRRIIEKRKVIVDPENVFERAVDEDEPRFDTVRALEGPNRPS